MSTHVTESPIIRALIVDDDALARERLRGLLQEETDVALAGECADGSEAAAVLAGGAVDLVFLDVQMPGIDGFGVVARVGLASMPPVIFTSAYSEFAVRAFEACALDYLLKPFNDERFRSALYRARQQISAQRERRTAAGATSSLALDLDARYTGLLEYLRRPQGSRYADAIAVRAGERYVMVRIAEIDWIEADGNYARLHVQQRPRLITKSLTALERDVLDPEVFVRVHRSAIVNTERIVAAEPLFHGELSLVLKDGSRVQCSRRHRKDIEERFYFTS